MQINQLQFVGFGQFGQFVTRQFLQFFTVDGHETAERIFLARIHFDLRLHWLKQIELENPFAEPFGAVELQLILLKELQDIFDISGGLAIIGK